MSSQVDSQLERGLRLLALMQMRSNSNSSICRATRPAVFIKTPGAFLLEKEVAWPILPHPLLVSSSSIDIYLRSLVIPKSEIQTNPPYLWSNFMSMLNIDEPRNELERLPTITIFRVLLPLLCLQVSAGRERIPSVIVSIGCLPQICWQVAR